MSKPNDEFEGYQRTRLERHKHIGAPNLALEMAERSIQQIMFMEREWADTYARNADLPGLLKTLVALGEAKFSTANEGQRALFETTEEWISRVTEFILKNWKVK